MNFSENLQALRKANNISQEQLAEKLGVTRQTVSKWETGGYPEMDKIIALCKMFGCTMDDLIMGDISADDAEEKYIAPQSEPTEEMQQQERPADPELVYSCSAPENPPHADGGYQSAGNTPEEPKKAKSNATAVIVAVTIIAVIAMLLVFAAYATRLALGSVFGGLSIDFSGHDISLFGFGGTNYTYANSSSYTAASEFTVADSITHIDVDWINGDVSIVPADGGEIYAYEIADTSLNGGGMMRYRVKDGTLYIKFREPGRFHNFKSKSLVIEVPEALSDLISLDISTVSAGVASGSMTFSDTDIETVSGVVSLSDFNTPELDVDTVSGGVTAYGSIGEADIDTVSGPVTFNSESANFKASIDTVSGKVRFEAKNIFNDIDITTVSGSVELWCGTPNRIDVDTVSGSIDVDGSHSKHSYTVSNVDGIGEIDIETTSGAITVKTK